MSRVNLTKIFTGFNSTKEETDTDPAFTIKQTWPFTRFSQLTEAAIVDPNKYLGGDYFNNNYNFIVPANLALNLYLRVQDWRIIIDASGSFDSGIPQGGGNFETISKTGSVHFEDVFTSLVDRTAFLGSVSFLDEIALVQPSYFQSLHTDSLGTPSIFQNISLSGEFVYVNQASGDTITESVDPSHSFGSILLQLLGGYNKYGLTYPSGLFDDRDSQIWNEGLGSNVWLMNNMGMSNQLEFPGGDTYCSVGYDGELGPQGLLIPGVPTLPNDMGSYLLTQDGNAFTGEYSTSIHIVNPDTSYTDQETYFKFTIQPGKWWTNGGMYDPDTGNPV